jgi:hypothetical protein
LEQGEKIVTLKSRVFLLISKMEAIGIPQRACASTGAFESLVTYPKERVNGQAL